MRIERSWAMPSHETFQIKPIRELLDIYVPSSGKGWIDPFARDSSVAEHTNDINPETKAKHHMDALEFLKTFDDNSVEGVLYDPPYSLRQIKECYNGLGKSLTQHETQYFFSDIKKEIERIVKPTGIVISFGWNSGGIGKTLGFTMHHILLVAHGGIHNDTIITVETKGEGRAFNSSKQFTLFEVNK